jgi:hypothetical protein
MWDPVGEFPWAVNRPELGQTGTTCEGVTPDPDTQDEFANKIQKGPHPFDGDAAINIHVLKLPP